MNRRTFLLGAICVAAAAPVAVAAAIKANPPIRIRNARVSFLCHPAMRTYRWSGGPGQSQNLPRYGGKLHENLVQYNWDTVDRWKGL